MSLKLIGFLQAESWNVTVRSSALNVPRTLEECWITWEKYTLMTFWLLTLCLQVLFPQCRHIPLPTLTLALHLIHAQFSSCQAACMVRKHGCNYLPKKTLSEIRKGDQSSVKWCAHFGTESITERSKVGVLCACWVAAESRAACGIQVHWTAAEVMNVYTSPATHQQNTRENSGNARKEFHLITSCTVPKVYAVLRIQMQ